jgi:primosomal protein N'
MIEEDTDGEIWFRCDTCGHEQEADKACEDCGSHGVIPFTKPYEEVGSRCECSP